MDALIPLTLAVPVYKRGKAVLPLLRSIASQAHPDDDLVVLDDASGDDLAAIVAEANTGFRFVGHAANLGMVGNWNACLSQARHPWICIVHHDDLLGPRALDALRAACAAAKGPALITHTWQEEPLDDRLRYRWCEPGPWSVLNVPTVPSGAVIHREIVDAIGGFDPQWKYSSDLEYFSRICARYPLLILESPNVVSYQLHDTNYQYKTWQQPDFEAQLRALERRIIGYAGLTGETAERRLDLRMRDMHIHMFLRARAIKDLALLRQTSTHVLRSRGLSWRMRAMATLAAVTSRVSRGQSLRASKTNEHQRTKRSSPPADE